MGRWPRFDRCSVPLARLDHQRELRVHMNEDAGCFWLLESVKTGATLCVDGIGAAAGAMLSDPEIPAAIHSAARAAFLDSRIERAKWLPTNANVSVGSQASGAAGTRAR
jgi:hypothetical protein